MKNFTETHNQEIKTLSIYTAITSFIIGTILFLFYWATKDGELVNLGLYYTVIAIIINSLLFKFNLLCALFTKKYWKNYLINSGVLLINAPIAFLYFYLVVDVIGF